MYFQDLDHLKKFNRHDVLELDHWIATRRKNTWKYLNPLQFSLDKNINESIALDLFLACTLDINLFEVRTIARCPECSTVLFKKAGYNILNTKDIYCPECYTFIPKDFLDDEIEIYFSLLKEPLPTNDKPSGITENAKKKANTLSMSKIRELSPSQEAIEKLLSLED